MPKLQLIAILVSPLMAKPILAKILQHLNNLNGLIFITITKKTIS